MVIDNYSNEHCVNNADYQTALDVQSACNLSGIIITFESIIKRICNEATRLNKGTEWKNGHPIAILFAVQIAYLTGAGCSMDSNDNYANAYDICTKLAQP